MKSLHPCSNKFRPNSATHDSSRVTVRQIYTVSRFHVLTILSVKIKSHRGRELRFFALLCLGGYGPRAYYQYLLAVDPGSRTHSPLNQAKCLPYTPVSFLKRSSALESGSASATHQRFRIRPLHAALQRESPGGLEKDPATRKPQLPVCGLLLTNLHLRGTSTTMTSRGSSGLLSMGERASCAGASER
jgi:hypothetical protein